MRADAPLGRLREAGLEEVDWLVAADPAGTLGYAPRGWPAETWILHGMWEDPSHASARIGDADTASVEAAGAGTAEVRTVEERWRAEHPGETGIGTLAYCSATFTELPPPAWVRLRWTDLATRLGAPLTVGWFGDYPTPPCFRWFPIRSWPETIWTPSEGTIDEPTGERLLAVLAEHSPEGLDTECFAYYDILDSPYRFERVVLTGALRAVFDAARHSPLGAGTPDNIWPADRSWLLWTEHDLWSTRLIGSRELVDLVTADTELETVDFTYRPPESRRAD